jgi:hypothetical protein
VERHSHLYQSHWEKHGFVPPSEIHKVFVSHIFTCLFTTVTPEFEGKLECINHMCARIKLHTCNDVVNIRYSAKA